jgi:acyl-CoA reductase-like NAD-dependent aldehyde dehydrogenase
VDSEASPHVSIYNPATGSYVGSAPILSAEQVHALVARARAAQPAWAAQSVAERARMMMRYRAVIANNAERVARTSCDETGKLLFEALITDVQTTCDLAKWYARRAGRIMRPRRVPAGWLVTKRAYEMREPYGVIGVIGPWNFPVLNCMRSVLAALMCGNTVVLKPSEASPLSALVMRELATEAGIPDDVFLVATGDGSTGAALVESGVDKLSFTGSVDTGRRIARAAAERLLPLSLELGGKDPMIVLHGADLDRAADAAVAGAFINAGQICTSIERAYVEASIYDEFLRRVVDRAKQVRLGADETADVGAITVEKQIELIEQQVDDALRHGARALVGGERVRGAGRYFAPTVLADVTQDMRIMREETFGPVLPIMKVADAEEAIRLANDSVFALGSSVWGKRAAAQRAARQLRAGMVSINDTLMNGVIAGLPFGGLKDSGYGRVYGDEAIREMTWARGVTVDRAGLREFAYYPLHKFGANRVRGMVQLLSAPGLRNKAAGLRRLITGR